MSIATAILFVGAAVAASVMGHQVKKRERFAWSERRRVFLGVHELIRPFDTERYAPEGRAHHETARRAFWLMVLLSLGTFVTLVV